jgi:hypothetical protein
MRKIDIVVVLAVIAGAGAITASRSTKQVAAVKSPALETPGAISRIRGGPFRLGGLEIGMTKAKVASICGDNHSTEQNSPFETWVWATKGWGTHMTLTFLDERLLTIARSGPANLLRENILILCNSVPEITRALGNPDSKTEEQITYHDLPGDLTFKLDHGQVTYITLAGSVSRARLAVPQSLETP